MEEVLKYCQNIYKMHELLMKNNTYGERKFISDMYFLGHTSNVHPLVIRARVVVISDGNFTGLSDPKESLETTTESEVGLSPSLFS